MFPIGGWYLSTTPLSRGFSEGDVLVGGEGRRRGRCRHPPGPPPQAEDEPLPGRLAPGVEEEEVADEIRALLKETFKLNPDHVQGHFTRAHFLKRMGDHEKAHKHFKRVVKLDPKNLEALEVGYRHAWLDYSNGVIEGDDSGIFAGLKFGFVLGR